MVGERKAPAGGELDDLEFLSSAAVRLAEIGPDEDVFQRVAHDLASLAAESLVVTSSYEPSTGSTIVRALAGPPDMIRAAEAAVAELIGLAFRVDEDARQGLAEGTLAHLEGGLHQLTFRSMPLELCRSLEAQLGIRSVYGQPFARKGDFLGTAAIMSRAPTLPRARVIEAFVRQVATVIQRRRIEAQLRESESRFRMLAENSQDVVFRVSLTPTFVYEYVSPASLRLIGYTPQELYSRPDIAITHVHPDDRAALDSILQHPADAPVVIRWRRKQGGYVWTELTLTSIRGPSGKLHAIEGTARDISARKEAEEALITADRRKNQFLAMLSHELRNPLAPIRNSLFILDHATPGGEQAGQARAVIERQVTHMARLVDDLLDVTRIGRGKIPLQRERLDFDGLVRRTVEDHRSLFAAKGIELQIAAAGEDLWLDGDRTRLAQVVGNLLQNAAKFTPRGGRTSVSVSREPGGWACLRVRDTGVGIAAVMLPRLFEPFMQADTTLQRGEGGLGLGLALIKGIVELHGGHATAASEGPGRGAELAITLPLAADDAVGRATERPTPHGVAARRILLIEDNVDAAESLREVLEFLKHTVDVAYSGTEGIAMAHALVPEVVLCDIGLPGMDGYEVGRTLRADARLRATTLVALTGYAAPEDVARAKEAGFHGHLAKPPSLEKLQEVLANAGAHLVRS